MQTIKSQQAGERTQITSYDELVERVPICELFNTEISPFWYKKAGKDIFSKRFKHEVSRKRDIFYDGNNGDRWQVRAVCASHKRILVENLSQGGMKLCFWK